MQKTLTTISNFLFGAKVLNILLPLLMVFLVLGTLAQKTMGLYAATELFFFSPIIWFWGLPLPGVPVLLGVLVFSLLGHVLFKSPFKKAKLGILLAHFGVIFLLGAGFFTAAITKEGALALVEGQAANFYADYHTRTLQVHDVTGGENTLVADVPFEAFLKEAGNATSIIPFPFAVLEVCENCGIVARTAKEGQSYYGMAQHMQLQPKQLELLNEKNLAGLAILVPEEGQQNVYLTLEGVPVLPEINVKAKTYTISLKKAPHSLPFTVELLDFERTLYPGTMKAAAYQSHVRIIDGPTTWEAYIKMNDPLRYKGYAFFQSSFAELPTTEGAKAQSILAVVHNPYRIWPYWATGLIALGILIHMFFGRSKNSLRKAAVMAFLCLGVTPSAYAANFDYQTFESLPILHEGRVKPMQTFAQSTIKTLTGSDHKASEVLTAILFAPQEAVQLPLIEIKTKSVVEALELNPDKGQHYSFAMLQKQFAEKRTLIEPLIKAERPNLTQAQAELVSAYEKTQLLAQLFSSLTVLMPLDITVEEGAAPKAYAQWQAERAGLAQKMKQLMQTKGAAIESYTETEQALAFLSFTLSRLEAEGQYASTLKVIPSEGSYLSPWEVVTQSKQTPETAKHFALWQSLARSYAQAEPAAFNKTLAELQTTAQPPKHLGLELLYNQIKPVKASLALYAFAFLALLFAAIFSAKGFRKVALGVTALGLIIHALGLAARVVILGRAPVGTLYESIVFVGVVLVGYALWRLYKSRDNIWLWLGVSGGLLLQVLALTLPHTGDNMTMLTAVLNTNFWLLVHVLTITAGYGFCLVVSGLAHVCYANKKAQKQYRPALRRVVRLALLFTFIGTLLGGVWADQSWGRFWGWDPKENGALLIVLWLIWLLHGEVTKSLKWRFVLAGYVLLSGVVATSWLGVNLLNVGLHSYGFTSAMAWLLVGIWAVEFAFLAVLWRGRK